MWKADCCYLGWSWCAGRLAARRVRTVWRARAAHHRSDHSAAGHYWSGRWASLVSGRRTANQRASWARPGGWAGGGERLPSTPLACSTCPAHTPQCLSRQTDRQTKTTETQFSQNILCISGDWMQDCSEVQWCSGAVLQ